MRLNLSSRLQMPALSAHPTDKSRRKKKNIMKKNTPRKLLIPLITAACMMYGCSSAPVSSPEAETTAEVQSDETNAEDTPGEESPSEQEKGQPEESGKKDEESSEAKTDNTDSKNTDSENTDNENTKGKSDDTADGEDDKDKNDKASEENKGEKSDNSSEEDSKESSKENSEEADAKKDQFVQMVKSAHPESFSGCTYGNAFEEFFTSPKWNYFESTDGRDVVEFTGECMYNGASTKTRMQFMIDNNHSVVTTGALYYNDTPQNTKVIAESLNRIFEQYAKAHDIAYTPSSSATKTSQTNALPPETQTENTSAQNAQTQNTQTENTSAQNAQTQNTQPGNTQAQSTPETTVSSAGAQAALKFAAWTNPNIGSWHSPSTGYYIIPYIDSAGNASLRFASENTQAASATAYYTDAVSAVTNDAGGLTYQAYLYKPSGEAQQLVGMVEVTWNSAAELKSLSVKMINGGQTMDNSMAGSDYAYYGAVGE